MKRLAVLALATLAASLSAQAANTVQVTGFTKNPFLGGVGPGSNSGTIYDASNSITKNTVFAAPPQPNVYPGGGQMTGLLNGQSFLAFCVEIDTLIKFSPPNPVYTDYVIINGSDPLGFGATKANTLAQLMTWAAMPGNLLDTAAKSAAMQAAVWEVVHESGSSYDFTAGNVISSSANGATQTALNAINWGTIASLTPTYTVSRLDGAAQDLLIFAPVPETGTLSMMLLGLTGLGVVAQRRLDKKV